MCRRHRHQSNAWAAALLPTEHRLALLDEGLGRLAVILARQRFVDDFLDLVRPFLDCPLCECLEHELRSLQRDRRIRGEIVGKRVSELERGGLPRDIEQSHPQAIIKPKQAPGEEHELGVGETNLSEKQVAVERPIYDAEPRCWYAHACSLIANPHVAGKCEAASAPNAKAVNSCDRRLWTIAHSDCGCFSRRFIDAPGLDRVAELGKLRDVSARAKMAASAGENDDANILPPAHIVEDITKPPPHGERERVALVRTVERHGRNACRVDVGQNIIADVLHLADLRTLRIPVHSSNHTSLRGSVLRAVAVAVPVLRQLGQFDHEIAGCFWVEKYDPAIAMPDHRLLLFEADTLGAQLGHCGADILDLEADVEEPLSVLGDPPACSSGGFVGLE